MKKLKNKTILVEPSSRPIDLRNETVVVNRVILTREELKKIYPDAEKVLDKIL
jgi:hypothetical protein